MKKWTKRSSIILLSFIVISASLCWLMTPGLGFSSLEITEFYSSSHDLEDGKYKIRPNEEITLYYSLNIWETGQSGFINWGDGNVVLLNEFDVFAYIKHSYSIEGYYEVTLWVLNPYYNDSSTLAIEVINDPPEFDIGVSYDLATYNFEDNSPNTSGKSIELFSDSGDIATSELPYKVEIIYDENVEGNVLSYSDYNIPSYPQTRDYFKKNPQWFGHDGKITYGYIYWFFKTSNPTSNTIFKVDNAIQFGVIDNYVQYYNFETSSYEVSNVIIEKDTWYFFKLYFGSSFYGVYMNGKPCYVNGGYGLPISNKEFFEYFEIIGDNENYESCNFYIDGLDYSWDPNSYSDYFEHHNEYWNDYFKKPDVFYMNSLIALNPKDLIEYSYDKQHLSYVWNTGDGQTCDDRIVRHSWGAKGTYKITLTIIDPFGALTTQDREITIVDPNSPEVVAGFDADFKYGIDPYATYNFKYDLVDSNPYYFNCSEDFDNSISIVSDLENHYKVCKIVGNLVPNDHGNYINNSFEEKNNGTIEWWASTNYISFNTAWDTKFSFYSRYDEFVGMIYYKNGDAYWYEGSTSTLLKQDLSKSGWNFWSVFWIENSVEIKLNNKEHWNVALKSLEDSINCFSINVYNSSQTLFIDGIGYSWDPNYILGESGALFSRTYKASYSFQFFPDGSIQDDYNDYSHAWGFFTNNEGELGDDCNAIIVPESEEHTKVLELRDNNTENFAAAVLLGASQPNFGTMELWFRTMDTSQGAELIFGSFVFRPGVRLILNDDWYFNDLRIENLPKIQNNTWHHIRLDFETSDHQYLDLPEDNFNFWVDGVKAGPYYFGPYASPWIEWTIFKTQMEGKNYSIFIDSLGITWDPGYTIGGNLYPKTGFYDKTSVIFSASELFTNYIPEDLMKYNEYYWNFGDNQLGYGKIVEHSYSKSGYYNVSLAIKSQSGYISLYKQKICVDNKPPSINVPIQEIALNEGEVYTFESFGSDTYNDFPRLAYFWTFLESESPSIPSLEYSQGWRTNLLARNDYAYWIAAPDYSNGIQEYVGCIDSQKSVALDPFNVKINNVPPSVSINGAEMDTNFSVSISKSRAKFSADFIIKIMADGITELSYIMHHGAYGPDLIFSPNSPFVFNFSKHYQIEVRGYNRTGGNYNIAMVFEFEDADPITINGILKNNNWNRPWIIDLNELVLSHMIDTDNYLLKYPIKYYGSYYDPSNDNLYLNINYSLSVLFEIKTTSVPPIECYFNIQSGNREIGCSVQIYQENEKILANITLKEVKIPYTEGADLENRFPKTSLFNFTVYPIDISIQNLLVNAVGLTNFEFESYINSCNKIEADIWDTKVGYISGLPNGDHSYSLMAFDTDAKPMYTFEFEPIGSNGTEIGFIDRMVNDGECNASIDFDSIRGHVLNIEDWDTQDNICLFNEFTAQNKGYVSFYWKSSDVQKRFKILFKNGGDITFSLRVDNGYFQYFNGVDWINIKIAYNNEWYFHEISFDVSLGTRGKFNWSINGVLLGSRINFELQVPSINTIELLTNNKDDHAYANYFDDIFYSWNPSYHIIFDEIAPRIIFNLKSTGYEYQELRFQAAVFDINRNLKSVKFTFGENNGEGIVEYDAIYLGKSLYMCNYSYKNEGTYLITIIAEDMSGLITKYGASFPIMNIAPKSKILSFLNGEEDQEIKFQGELYDSPEEINELSYFWDWGDGTISCELNPTHIWSKDGTYNITLTVIDANGDLYSDVKQIIISGSPPKIEGPFTIYGVEGEKVIIDPKVTDSYYDALFHSFSYDIYSKRSYNDTAKFNFEQYNLGEFPPDWNIQSWGIPATVEYYDQLHNNVLALHTYGPFSQKEIVVSNQFSEPQEKGAIELFIKPLAENAVDWPWGTSIVVSPNNNYYNYDGITVYFGPEGNVSALVKTSQTRSFVSFSRWDPSSWNHLVIEFDCENHNFSVWINGVKSLSNAALPTFTYPMDALNYLFIRTDVTHPWRNDVLIDTVSYSWDQAINYQREKWYYDDSFKVAEFTNKAPSITLDNGLYFVNFTVTDVQGSGAMKHEDLTINIQNIKPTVFVSNQIYYGNPSSSSGSFLKLKAYALDSSLDTDDLYFNWKVLDSEENIQYLQTHGGPSSFLNYFCEYSGVVMGELNVTDGTEFVYAQFQIFISIDSDGNMIIDEIQNWPLLDDDGDGLLNGLEILLGTNPNVIDTDADLLTDYEEYLLKTKGVNNDTDGDYLIDGIEAKGWNITIVLFGQNNAIDMMVTSDPLKKDTDSDNILDYGEYTNGTNPRAIDTDGDWRYDYEEINGVRLTNTYSWISGKYVRDKPYASGPIASQTSDPSKWDTDGDLLSDGAELDYIYRYYYCKFEFFWRDTNVTKQDTDDDGLTDYKEYYGVNSFKVTDPTNPDSDYDYLLDGKESYSYKKSVEERVSIKNTGDQYMSYSFTFSNLYLPKITQAQLKVIISAGESPKMSSDASKYLEWKVILNKNEQNPVAINLNQSVIINNTRYSNYFVNITDVKEKVEELSPTAGYAGTWEIQIKSNYNALLEEFSLEVTSDLDPRDSDTDNDYLCDGEELDPNKNRGYTTNPLNPDTDEDGLTDYQETRSSPVFRDGKHHPTNPLSSDTDGDGVNDKQDINPNYNLILQLAPIEVYLTQDPMFLGDVQAKIRVNDKAILTKKIAHSDRFNWYPYTNLYYFDIDDDEQYVDVYASVFNSHWVATFGKMVNIFGDNVECKQIIDLLNAYTTNPSDNYFKIYGSYGIYSGSHLDIYFDVVFQKKAPTFVVYANNSQDVVKTSYGDRLNTDEKLVVLNLNINNTEPITPTIDIPFSNGPNAIVIPISAFSNSKLNSMLQKSVDTFGTYNPSLFPSYLQGSQLYAINRSFYSEKEIPQNLEFVIYHTASLTVALYILEDLLWGEINETETQINIISYRKDPSELNLPDDILRFINYTSQGLDNHYNSIQIKDSNQGNIPEIYSWKSVYKIWASIICSLVFGPLLQNITKFALKVVALVVYVLIKPLMQFFEGIAKAALLLYLYAQFAITLIIVALSILLFYAIIVIFADLLNFKVENHISYISFQKADIFFELGYSIKDIYNQYLDMKIPSVVSYFKIDKTSINIPFNFYTIGLEVIGGNSFEKASENSVELNSNINSKASSSYEMDFLTVISHMNFFIGLCGSILGIIGGIMSLCCTLRDELFSIGLMVGSIGTFCIGYLFKYLNNEFTDPLAVFFGLVIGGIFSSFGCFLTQGSTIENFFTLILAYSKLGVIFSVVSLILSILTFPIPFTFDDVLSEIIQTPVSIFILLIGLVTMSIMYDTDRRDRILYSTGWIVLFLPFAIMMMIASS